MTLKIGTRGSPLALAQAHETRARLMAAHGMAEAEFEIVVISTTGDRITDRPLGEIGGKGLFTKEIEEALLSGGIDLAVHSMKDMPVLQPEGLALCCYLPREDVRDAFLSERYASLDDMPEGARVGSSSLRRRAQLMHRYPLLKVVEFRGNVQTRFKKLADGVADATFLAVAGLNRLGVAQGRYKPIAPDVFLPAIAQGAIGIEIREADSATRALLAPINHSETETRLAAERALLKGLDGSCQTPIAGLAEINGQTIRLRGEVLRPDGSELITRDWKAPRSEAAELGSKMAEDMLKEMPKDFF